MSARRTMQSLLVLLLCAFGGCVSHRTIKETDIQRLLDKGDYHAAIAAIERGPRSAESRFSLALLYAYREIVEMGDRADLAKALQLIRSAAADNEQAREFLADYKRRGRQAFIAFPWAHLIGPFPKRDRPESVG